MPEKTRESTCLKVDKTDANSVIQKLLRDGMVDKSIRIRRDGDHILIPLLSKGDITDPRYPISYDSFKEREVVIPPQIRINNALKTMGIRSHAPEKWTRLGKALIVRDLKGRSKDAVAKAMADVLNVNSVYEISGRIQGEMRKPVLTRVFGKGGDIVHLENGVRYRFDPEKVMFSPGNVNERALNPSIDFKDKVVWDMFSGIGYFSIPIARYGYPKLVYCTDINPDAIEYLRKNAAINEVEGKIVPINLDCRKFVPQLAPNRIIMGNFDAPSYLDVVNNLAGINAVVIIHHLVRNSEEDNLERINTRFGKLMSRSFRIVNHRVVKSYSPKRFHVVTTISLDDQSPL